MTNPCGLNQPPFRALLRFSLISIAICVALTGASSASHAATLTVQAGENLQAAINNAQPGDTIVLEAGAEFVGPFYLPKKTGDSYITIQSSRLSELPGAGQRVTPSHSSLMPRLVDGGVNTPVIEAHSGAHHFRFIGIEIRPRTPQTELNALVAMDAGWSVQASQAHHIVFDRCYMHGYAGQGNIRRAVSMNGGHTEVLNSYISEIHHSGTDAQAVAGWYGTGPFKIINNHLEATGENILFGGGDPGVQNLSPSDIEIRGNYVYKPTSWRGKGYVVKNHIELKHAKRVVIDGNHFENVWAEGQDGFSFVLAPTNQDGTAPWSEVSDVQITNNRIRHAGGAFNLGGRSNNYQVVPLKRVTIRNNVVEDIDGTKWGGWRGCFLMIGSAEQVVVDHNTSFHEKQAIIAYDRPNTGFQFTNNVMSNGIIHGPGNNIPEMWSKNFPGAVVRRNAFVGLDEWRSGQFPQDNFYIRDLAGIGFVDLAGGNYHLAPKSVYKGKATTKSDIGCDLDVLEAVGTNRATTNFKPA